MSLDLIVIVLMVRLASKTATDEGNVQRNVRELGTRLSILVWLVKLVKNKLQIDTTI